MIHSLARSRTTSLLRAALVMLCLGAILLGGVLSPAAAVAFAPAGVSTSAKHGQAAAVGGQAQVDHENTGSCDRPCERTSRCSSACVIGCVAGGTSSACVTVGGLRLPELTADGGPTRAPDTLAPSVASSPPPLPPPIV